ncbi:tetratricopeptide repeat protein [Stutzerimonas sp. VN223-3]|uniref:tetratricopeptide repeat protein n=1 Tax=Stutzerimonas sp. VN223-3 TaxID=3384601 RepID=UPI0038B58E7A
MILAAATVVQGCATVKRGAIPVVDSGAPVSEEVSARQPSRVGNSPAPTTRSAPADSGVMVMVPQQNSEPLQTFAAPDITFSGSSSPVSDAPGQWTPPVQPAPGPTPRQPVPNGIPSNSGTLSADERLDGPVLALLTTAQQQQGGGDLNGAASSLERAQRIAPREPQVLYRLAQVRLAQGDAVQAEQLSRRGLSYANDRPALQASLWELIAQARERQGNAAGAAQARERAKVAM